MPTRDEERRSKPPEPPRLILASNRARHVPIVAACRRQNVVVVKYKYDTFTLDEILEQIRRKLNGMRVESIGLLMHCSETEIFICFMGGKVLNLQSVKEDISIREFFSQLVTLFINRSYPNRRVDFLNCYTALHVNGGLMARELESLLSLPVGMSKDLFGADVQLVRLHVDSDPKNTVGELYFHIQQLQEQLKNVREGSQKDKLDGYEKIRTVGKGAFGIAVLYRRIEDDVMVVLKEVNMNDLTAAERQMALNEVQVLALMDHPNIISYLGSFEKDGVLMIEMEYADGGTLAQMLAQKSRRMEEREILMIFRQIVAAIRYMHDHNILHRDLKTANVFLTKERSVKVGDFGISKRLETRSAANTVLGTPYYISPEMCEGKQYDQKSDIWALGCILYEMACLQKTFEGSNLPALVNKIMKGHFQPIRGSYSPGFRQLIHDLLQRDPGFRPKAEEIMDYRIPELLDNLHENGEWFKDNVGDEPNIPGALGSSRNSSTASRKAKPQRSVLYHFKAFDTTISLTPMQLPPRSKIKQVAVSNTHIIVLTAELLVFTWGEGKKGQLGHEQAEMWRSTPECVENLKGKSITKVGAGDGFSVFVSDTGMLMTCGDGTFGCLGHGDWNNSVRPKLIEKLLTVDVCAIGCGPHHVAVVSGEGLVYSWGRGDGGRLGVGHEEDCCTPELVMMPEEGSVKKVCCGGDGTIILMEDGTLYACGRNTNNKLGLSERLGLLTQVKTMSLKAEVEKAVVPTRVKSIAARVADVSMGPTHTAVLTESGHILTFGRNTEGQLGRGHTRTSDGPSVVKYMADKYATMVQCGPTYTVAGTIENAVYFWGTRHISPLTRPNTQEMLHAQGLRMSGSYNLSRSHQTMRQNKTGSASSTNYTSILTASSLQHQQSLQFRDVILEPQEILALYASPKQISKGETVSLAGVFSQHHSIYILVDTTAPLARFTPRSELLNQALQQANTTEVEEEEEEENEDVNHHATKEEQKQRGRTEEKRRSEKEYASAESAEVDSLGPVPEWIKAELAESDAVWPGFVHQKQK